MANRIIVVEDESIIAHEIKQAVLASGCEYAGRARTISESLTMFANTDFNGVVLDANLKGESAKPLVDFLREKNVPYMMVSGYAREQLEYLDEATFLISKPFSFDELVTGIRDNLSNL